MKKIFSLTTVFVAMISTLLATGTTFAIDPAALTITGQESASSIVINNYNGTLELYIDNVKYTGGIIAYIDDFGDSFTTPNIGYGIEIKGISNQSFKLNGNSTEITSVHINNNNGTLEFYINNVAYQGGLINYIEDYAESFTSPNVGHAIKIFTDLRPAISGQENFVTSVDDARPLSFFQSYLKAIDETDGDISNSIYVINDNYTTNKSVLGTYKVTFGVKDSSQNESTIEVNITVSDVTKPVITGNSSKATISYTQTWNITTFKSTLTVTDNYATLTHADVTVKNDGYTSNKANLGTYNVVYAVVDPSGNEATFTKQVEVIDDIAPVFAGPTILTKPATQVLTINEIKAQLTATDAKEGNKTAQIIVLEDNFTGKGNKVGNYTITFQVADSKGNKSTHVVTISVQDNIPPVWYIQDGVSFKIVQPATLTRQQIIDLLVATNQLTVNSTTQITFIIDEYSGNEKTPGDYMVSIGYADTAGNEGVHNLTVSVLEDGADDQIVVDPKGGFDIVEFVTSPLGILLIIGSLVGIVIVFKKKK